ncbi:MULTISPECIES: hypothetical protein [unclassified Aminobacter]|uniref:phage nozzle protein n=1 Tax=unclassified Aminobacter TaxID=2644704 RepID=UPI0004667CD3|nr:MULTISPECIES: hypothetical protein [unclassified Aminobacter]TWH35592.1 hypothetical protein L611_001200000730 [Aminobacter sp. J15]
MTAVSGGIPNVVGGISQQPPELRTLNSAADLRNTWCDPANGLSTRPCGEFRGKAGLAPLAEGNTVATHDIQKPSGQYRISVHSGGIVVTNLTTGMMEPVNFVGMAGSYIDTKDAASDLGFFTVGDTTFIYNRKVIVQATLYDESGVTGIDNGGVLRRNPFRHGTLWVKQRAGYKANYAMYINGIRVGLVQTDDKTPAEIASDLRSQAQTAGHTVNVASETVLSVQFADEQGFLTSHDDYGNQAIFSYNEKVDEFTDLPNFDAHGRLVLIQQSRSDKEDDYWVWYANGQWEETYGWDSREILNAATMPHVLVDNGDGTWTFKQHTWKGREVGDRDSNPTPSFVGRTINRMWAYKGRMCILSDENFIASQVGHFENFYRSTCTQLLDEDPIDIASPNSRGALLGQAMDFDGQLLLFSQFEQFRLESDREGILSPNTVSIKRVNSYNNAVGVEPTYIGPNVIFVDDFRGRAYASLREYQIDRTFGREIAPSITEHVPELIPSGVYRIMSSSSDNILFLLSEADRKKLWFYNFFNNEEGKILSAWQIWEFPFDIYGGGFVDDKLVLTVEYDGELHILSFNFQNGADQLLSEASVLLDYRVPSSLLGVTYYEGNTWIIMPYWIQSMEDLERHLVVISPNNQGSIHGCKTYKPVYAYEDMIMIPNVDLTGEDFYVGWTYDFEWELNPIYVRDAKLVAIQDGRLQLRSVSFLYANSGPFEVHVTPFGRDTHVKKQSGFIVGSVTDKLGEFSFNSGKFRVLAPGEASKTKIRVKASTPWRVRFSSLEWDGAYRPKKRRTT